MDNISEKCLQMAKDLKKTNPFRCKHFSFIVQRSNILAVGQNQQWQTHPIAQEFGHKFSSVHSELDAWIKIRHRNVDLSKCRLINVRINRFEDVKISRPCVCCSNLLQSFGLTDWTWTLNGGGWQRIKK